MTKIDLHAKLVTIFLKIHRHQNYTQQDDVASMEILGAADQEVPNL